MGPGVSGQLITMDRADPEQARTCRTCHAPLAEQQAGAAPIIPFLGAGSVAVPGKTESEIHAAGHEGLTCAGCHVRGHRRYGPPRAADSSAVARDAVLPHDGFTAEPAFSDSRFCRGCHQFGPDGYALNGKLLENTYNEWLSSEYARRGVQCQDCHMPGRRHLWRGVHDPDMMRQAVSVDVSTPELADDALTARITITNTGAGHYFPSYSTPRVIVRARLVDDAGETIPDTIRESIIGRELSLDLEREVFDTRIPPKDHMTLTYEAPSSPSARILDVELISEPDYFYSRFYAGMLDQGMDGRAKTLIETAARQASASVFSFHHQRIAVEEGSRPSAVVSHAPAGGETNSAPVGVDWNETGIRWYGYDQGLDVARRGDRPILLIFYADWCPTCHAYRRIFADPEVLEMSQRFVMVRVNVDRQPELNTRFSGQGGLVPRTYLLQPAGRIMSGVEIATRGFPHFLSANDPAAFVAVMHQALAQVDEQG